MRSALCALGFGVLRFDFTGLGASEGEFANTNFSSNVDDILHAVAFMREHHRPPAVLIGHSLGGAAILDAAPDVPEAKAVATIGAPGDPRYLNHLFTNVATEIESEGEARVDLGGRPFTIRKQFIDDLARHDHLQGRIRKLRKALIVFHAPRDQVVGIENAAAIFAAHVCRTQEVAARSRRCHPVARQGCTRPIAPNAKARRARSTSSTGRSRSPETLMMSSERA